MSLTRLMSDFNHSFAVDDREDMDLVKLMMNEHVELIARQLRLNGEED